MAVDATHKAERRRLASFRACTVTLVITSFVALFAWTGTVFNTLLHGARPQTVREAVQAATRTAPDGRPYVVMTAGTSAYFPFIGNLRCSLLHATGDGRMLLAALDRQVRTLGENANFIPITIGKPIDATKVAMFGSVEFRSITRRKLDAVHAVLKQGVDVFFVDGDVHMCDNLDWVFKTVSDFGASAGNILAQRASVTAELINSGVYFARADDANVALFEQLRTYDAANDQVAFNALMCRSQTGGHVSYGEGEDHGKPSKCTWTHPKRNISSEASFLPESRFPLGCTTVSGVRVRDLPRNSLAQKCRSRELTLVHFSCWSSWNKKSEMQARDMWLWNERTGKCTF